MCTFLKAHSLCHSLRVEISPALRHCYPTALAVRQQQRKGKVLAPVRQKNDTACTLRVLRHKSDQLGPRLRKVWCVGWRYQGRFFCRQLSARRQPHGREEDIFYSGDIRHGKARHGLQTIAEASRGDGEGELAVACRPLHSAAEKNANCRVSYEGEA